MTVSRSWARRPASRRRSTAPAGASARPRRARTRSSRAGRPRDRSTSAAPRTPKRRRCGPRPATSRRRAARREIASSKSRALAGSIVNVGSSRRSRRPCRRRSGASAASRASCSTAGSNDRRRPRSSISASITSRATSGRPSRREITTPPRTAPATGARRHDHQVANVGLAIAADCDPRPGLEERLGDQELARAARTATRAAGRESLAVRAHLISAATVCSAFWSAVSTFEVSVRVRVHVGRDAGSATDPRRHRGCDRSG